ncbi:hypothetical protein DL95DRAFT_447830 [Leptodontidium sp. 2 PMI_412]|nr:hypothetical protein DL95DRAFT_447830 [Leptodontidium sp. 2 PMI_412]
MSNGYAPGNNPRSRGVQESDRYKPKPAEYEEAPSRTSRAYVAGDNPRSRGVQKSDNYRPEPIEHREKPVRSRYSASQGAMLAHPIQPNGFESWRPRQRPSNNVPSFAAGTTLFSFNDDINLEDSPGHIPMKNSLTTRKFESSIVHDEDMHDGPAFPQPSTLGPQSGTGPFLLTNSEVLPRRSEYRTRQFLQVGNDGKPVRMEDPAASRRLFGGIIKSRRSSEAAITLPSPSPPRSDYSSRTTLPLRIISSPSPTLARQYGVPRGFELVRGATQPLSKSNNSNIPNTALTPISTNTHSEIRPSSLFSYETRGTLELETSWQRMVRELNERWKNSSG